MFRYCACYGWPMLESGGVWCVVKQVVEGSNRVVPQPYAKTALSPPQWRHSSASSKMRCWRCFGMF